MGFSAQHPFPTRCVWGDNWGSSDPTFLLHISELYSSYFLCFCKSQKYSYLVRRLGEHSLFPEVRGQITVGLGDGIEGGFSYGQKSKIACHSYRNPLTSPCPRSSKNVEFRKEQGDHRRVSLIMHTKLKFLSLSIYDNYTTSNKCNRADWEISFYYHQCTYKNTVSCN